jgi:Recombinase
MCITHRSPSPGSPWTGSQQCLGRDADRNLWPAGGTDRPTPRHRSLDPQTVRTTQANPKYTGYMAWNLRASKRGGKTNPIDRVGLLVDPTHQRIVSVEAFQLAATIGQWLRGSAGRCGGEVSSGHPVTTQ